MVETSLLTLCLIIVTIVGAAILQHMTEDEK
jgi:hypothetical protein